MNTSFIFTNKITIIIIVVCLITIGVIFYSLSTKLAIPLKNNPSFNTDVSKTKTAILGGGCFWCIESDFEKLFGVIDVVSGYTGGTEDSPTYKNYANNGHREVVEVTYDPTKVTYGGLVEYLIKHSDPTDPDGSFYDRGVEYAPAVYYENDEEKNIASAVISEIDALHVFDKPIALLVIPRVKFWPAEKYHQDYYKKNPIRYAYYRSSSGRDNFIKKYWTNNTNISLDRNIPNDLSIQNSNAFWKKYKKPSAEILKTILTKLQYHVTQENGTEPPFDNEYDKNERDGIYVDILSGEPLFSSLDKYDSGTGWPSFVKPISLEAVILKADKSLFSFRTEVRSRFSDSHLGHVFNDGPANRGGLRYCMNSAALRFIPKEELADKGYSEYLKLFN